MLNVIITDRFKNSPNIGFDFNKPYKIDSLLAAPFESFTSYITGKQVSNNAQFKEDLKRAHSVDKREYKDAQKERKKILGIE